MKATLKHIERIKCWIAEAQNAYQASILGTQDATKYWMEASVGDTEEADDALARCREYAQNAITQIDRIAGLKVQLWLLEDIQAKDGPGLVVGDRLEVLIPSMEWCCVGVVVGFTDDGIVVKSPQGAYETFSFAQYNSRVLRKC